VALDPSRGNLSVDSGTSKPRITLVNRKWNLIEAWLRDNAPRRLAGLRPVATDARIAATEEFLGVIIPGPVRLSYRIHDGQLREAPGMIGGWEFRSPDRIGKG